MLTTTVDYNTKTIVYINENMLPRCPIIQRYPRKIY